MYNLNMFLLDGKLVSNSIVEQLKIEVNKLKDMNIVPTLVIIQVGNNEASNVYIKNKLRLANVLNTKTVLKKFPTDITTEQLIKEIKALNNDKLVNGILVQMPLPTHIKEAELIDAICPNKDVDCFHLSNIGKLWSARKTEVRLKPCTPAGIIELLKYYKIPISERKAVVIGRSNIVGKPMASLLLLEDATVTLCHSKTPNIHELCKDADILVSAVGKSKLIDRTFLKKGAVVIDVGMNHDENHKLCGDVDFNDVKDIVSYITPVPGGVGPMTVTMLMKNLIELTKIQIGL